MFQLDAPLRVAAMELASSLGMSLMVHIADPDTWFQTRYSDAARYGTKSAQYLPLERLLDRFSAPWLAAHMGGWPEDLHFLAGILDRHPNLFWTPAPPNGSCVKFQNIRAAQSTHF